MLVSPETPLDPKAAEEVKLSRRVHTSVDTVNQSLPQSSEGGTGSNTPATEGKDDEGGDEGEGEGEDELPDHDERSIANTRSPKEGDGILELDDLVEMMNEVLPGGATSTLGCIKHEEGAECFGSRGGLEGMHGRGRDEPAYTCYTPLFKLTLGKPRFMGRSADNGRDAEHAGPKLIGKTIRLHLPSALARRATSRGTGRHRRAPEAPAVVRAGRGVTPQGGMCQ